MDEYDQLWDAIWRSPFMGVYIGELYWLASHVEEDVTQVFTDAPAQAQGGESYVRVDHALHGRILAALLAAARIRALVRSRERQGSRGQREVLARRTSTLRGLLDEIDLGPILEAATRHSIEHFDEQIDSVALKSYRGVIRRPALPDLQSTWCSALVGCWRSLRVKVSTQRPTPSVRMLQTSASSPTAVARCGWSRCVIAVQRFGLV